MLPLRYRAAVVNWMNIAAAGLLGAFIGSFMATILLRWPRGESAVRGRSRCDSCGTPLTPRSLVPVLSWLAQRGRCRSCGGRIAVDHLLMEVGAAVVGMAAAIVAQSLAGWTAAVLLGWLLLLVAAFDLRHFWLPDPLTGLLAAAGVGVNLLGEGPGIAASLGGMVGGFASLWLVARAYRHLRGREGLGGGDPKLFGAIGAWLSWQALPMVLLGACALGLLAALACALLSRKAAGPMKLPFGALLAVAAWPAWLVVA
jgi:leader peptidase (prepilin peptidase)/N-methyltransferase